MTILLFISIVCTGVGVFMLIDKKDEGLFKKHVALIPLGLLGCFFATGDLIKGVIWFFSGVVSGLLLSILLLRWLRE